MNIARALEILCDPQTRDALILERDALVNPKTARKFPIRDGIVCFLDQATGLNLKYQKLYDRLAPVYDLGENIYLRFFNKEGFRGFLRDAIEVPPRARVLEVSVGTGANLAYLPASIEFYGLDLSWGMLGRCRRNLARWKREAFLCQGEAEHLPFRDANFDVVFHVGGINFFNDRALAIREMIRVARPGTKIVIADETEEAVQSIYERMPFVRRFFKARDTTVSPPTDLVPKEMQELRLDTVFDGKMYLLSFHTPGKRA